MTSGTIRGYLVCALVGAISIVCASEVTRALLPVCDNTSADEHGKMTRLKDFLQQQIEIELRRRGLEASHLSLRPEQVVSEMEAVDVQITIAKQRVKIAEEVLTSGDALAIKGLISNAEQSRRATSVLETQDAYRQLTGKMGTKRGELEELRYTIEMAKISSEVRIATLQRDLGEPSSN